MRLGSGPLGHIPTPYPPLSFSGSWAWESGLGSGALPRPAGVAIALSRQLRYPGSPRRRGGDLEVEARALVQWPPGAPSSPGTPAARWARLSPRRREHAQCPRPVPGSAARAPPSRARPRRSRARLRFVCAALEAATSGLLLAAGGAAVAQRGLGGADRRWAARTAAAAGSAGQQPASPTAALPPAYRPARWRGVARWRRYGGRSGACRSRRTPQRSARAPCSASWTTRGS